MTLKREEVLLTKTYLYSEVLKGTYINSCPLTGIFTKRVLERKTLLPCNHKLLMVTIGLLRLSEEWCFSLN